MKALLSAIAVGVLASGSALGADLGVPLYRAPAVFVPAASWTGLYVGVHGGYGWSNSDVDPVATNVFCNPIFTGEGCVPNVLTNAQGAAIGPALKTNPKGGVLGGQIGYNYQFGSVVAGFETDLSYTYIAGSSTQGGFSNIVGFPGSSVVAATAADQRLRYFGTVRGRLGYLVTNPLLVYVTSGLAYGKVNSSTALAEILTNGDGATFIPGAGSVSTTRTGWTIGGGLEYLLPGNWTLKTEYLYFNLGSTSYALSPVMVIIPPGITATTVGATSMTADFRGSIVRVGLNYKFGSAAAAPVYK